MSNIYLGQPCYGAIELEACDAVDQALQADSPHQITAIRMSSSLLANCFNSLLGACLQSGAFDYFVLLHSDVAPAEGWLGVLIAELEQYRLDVIHAPCALKNGKGLTSTALAYSDDPWQPVRRLTTRELAQLHPTFTAAYVRNLDPAAKILLPNTGCMLLKLGPWLDRFPGFEIRDRLRRVESQNSGPSTLDPRPSTITWHAEVVSEDWNFGYWCAANGVRVGCTTKVATRHIGRMPFPTGLAWGTEERDEIYFELTEEARGEGRGSRAREEAA
jgi:hypothetical protein